MINSQIDNDEALPATEEVLLDPAASDWIKSALRSALERDPVDAANDADLLARLLMARQQDALEHARTLLPEMAVGVMIGCGALVSELSKRASHFDSKVE